MLSDDLVFVCEVCGMKIKEKDKSIRIVVDTCVSDGMGGGSSTEEDYELVLSVFHRECVMATSASRDCDAIPYITEAREVLSISISNDFDINLNSSEEYGKN